MKYQFKDTDEMYVKVYPYSSSFINPKHEDMEQMKRGIERHIDNIGSVELYQEELYTYSEGGIDYEAHNLVDLCSNIAYDRDTLNDGYNWRVSWYRNNEKYWGNIWSLEDLLDCISRYNCIIENGHLSDSQKALVNVARDLYDGNN